MRTTTARGRRARAARPSVPSSRARRRTPRRRRRPPTRIVDFVVWRASRRPGLGRHVTTVAMARRVGRESPRRSRCESRGLGPRVGLEVGGAAAHAEDHGRRRLRARAQDPGATGRRLRAARRDRGATTSGCPRRAASGGIRSRRRRESRRWERRTSTRPASVPTPGEIVEFDAPHTLTYHWWSGSRSGKLKTEGWPGYSLEAADDGTTLVRHHAKLHTYGLYRLATPALRWIARRGAHRHRRCAPGLGRSITRHHLRGNPCPTSRASTPPTSGVPSRHTATWTWSPSATSPSAAACSSRAGAGPTTSSPSPAPTPARPTTRESVCPGR